MQRLSATAVPSPDAVRLRPHHPVLRRGPDAVQLGVLPGRAVEATGLAPPLLSLLLELNGTWRVDDVLARARGLGADQATALTLLDELTAAGGLLDAAEAHRAERARQEAVVQLYGTGPLLAEVADELAAAGIGTLWVDSPPPPAGHRADELLTLARDRAAGADVQPGRPRRRPDLAVLTDALAPDPARCRDLAARGVPHLVARMADGFGLVGPLVLPGRSACPHCVTLHHADRDPHWPLVTAQLADRTGSGGPATLRATAALTAEQAVLAVGPAGPNPPAALDAVLELDLALGSLYRRRWPPHPGCECGAAHTTTTPAGAHSPTSARATQLGEPAGGSVPGGERDHG
jgi:bacteriocin biosynthesis cyclodehydratase domain-containing protein